MDIYSDDQFTFFFFEGMSERQGICDISRLDGDNGIPGCSQRLVHFPNVMTHSLQSPGSGESGLGRVSRAPFSLLGSPAGWLAGPNKSELTGFSPEISTSLQPDQPGPLLPEISLD